MKTHGKVTVAEVRKALNVILSDTKNFETSLNWAVNYVRAAMSMDGEALAVQCLYILNNLSTWRHKEAKDVRLVLREYAKQEGK